MPLSSSAAARALAPSSGGRKIPSARRYDRKESVRGINRAFGVIERYLGISLAIYYLVLCCLPRTKDANNGLSNVEGVYE
jgi:hypothetical protein